LTGAALLFGLSAPAWSGAEKTVSVGNRAAPDFSRVALDQSKVTLSSLRGKVVLLNFWATWCAPCLTEIPRFIDWQQEYGGRGLQVVGVSMDDEETRARAAYGKYRVNYPVVMGDEKLGELYGGVLGLPVIFLIDKEGEIRFRHQGRTNLNVIEREMKELLRAH
jgi:thiol-disulfide isomerase/thioredoxin